MWGSGFSFQGYPSIYLFIYLSIYLVIYLSIHVSIYLSVYINIFSGLEFQGSGLACQRNSVERRNECGVQVSGFQGYIYSSIYLYLSIYIYMYIYIFIYIYIYIHIYIYVYVYKKVERSMI